MSGLSETPLASMRRVVAAWRRRSRQAPITWGWQRRQYGSWIRSSPVRCEARMALPASSPRRAAATSICPAWRLSAWMRPSNGVSDPRAPSVDNAPVAKAELNSVSALNKPTSALAVENCVPLSSASPSLGRGVIGSSPTSASAAAAGAMRSPPRATPPAPPPPAVHRPRHMGGGPQTARGARRSLRRDHRRDAARQHGLDEGNRLRLDARCALRQAAELQRHHEPRCRDRRRFAHARSVREDNVALKFSEVCGLDANARQFAEAGINSVDRFAAGENALHCRRARDYDSTAGGINGQRLAAPDRPPVSERRLAGADNDGHCPLQTR